MFAFQGARLVHSRNVVACWAAMLLLIGSPLLRAQDEVDIQVVTEKGTVYVPAIEVLPDSLAGLVRIPNLPKFCEAWNKTHIGQLMEDEAMQPYIELQRDRVIDYVESFGSKVGLRPQDLYDIASGEVVIAWLPFEKDNSPTLCDLRRRGHSRSSRQSRGGDCKDR